MARLRCIGTCYMPTGKKPKKGIQPEVERFEDIEGEDLFEVEEDRMEEFLTTGNFVAA